LVRVVRIRGLLVWFAIFLAVVWSLAPLAWGVLTTFKTGTQVYNNEWVPWLQFDPSLRNWHSLFRLPVLREALVTSTIVATAVATGSVALAAPAMYGIARMGWTGRWQRGLLLAIISQRIMPPVIFITPFLLLSTYFHLRDTIPGLVIVDIAFMLPLAAIVSYSGYSAVHPELIESAHLDGASAVRAFLQIASPLARSALAAAWVLCLAFTWNEWLYADFMRFNNLNTMPVALIAVVGGGGGGNVPSAVARAMAMMVVPMIAGLASQRFIASGLSIGAVKG
jgi:multiple sugar transport system permease protein